jgi:hypothetical protein
LRPGDTISRLVKNNHFPAFGLVAKVESASSSLGDSSQLRGIAVKPWQSKTFRQKYSVAKYFCRGNLKRFVKSIWQQILNRELEAFYIEKFSPIILVFELKKLILRKKNKKSS